jgi:hypothetical protein
MNRAIALVVALILWTVAAFFVGWQVRDGSADTAVAKTATQQQTARADQAEGARAVDHANAATSGAVQQQRAEAHVQSANNFKSIDKRVDTYVQANPDPVGCDLDGDGLRAWREANAGAVLPSAGPVYTGGPVVP